jgi:hypothetical protein
MAGSGLRSVLDICVLYWRYYNNDSVIMMCNYIGGTRTLDSGIF